MNLKIYFEELCCQNIPLLGPFYDRVSFLNTLRPGQDERHSADDIFMCIFFNENCCIFIKFSLKYVRKDPIDNNPALVQIMAWCRSGDKPLSEPMMISLPTHICVTLPQWVKSSHRRDAITHAYHVYYMSSALLALCEGNPPDKWQADSPHKGPAMQKIPLCREAFSLTVSPVRQVHN